MTDQSDPFDFSFRFLPILLDYFLFLFGDVDWITFADPSFKTKFAFQILYDKTKMLFTYQRRILCTLRIAVDFYSALGGLYRSPLPPTISWATGRGGS